LLDQLQEPAAIDEQVAPGELEHAFEVGAGETGRQRSDRSLDRRLATVVVQVGVVQCEQAQRITVSTGQEPVLQGRGYLAGVLEPARGPGMLLHEPSG
jgi:hypothetical protein